MDRLYRAGEFAALTKVSIRTLHHYDRIGLLRPSAYSEGRQRLYSAEDLLRLQQILTLRYLGFALKDIGELLARPDYDLVASMWIQRGVLRDRVAELGRIEAALGELVERRLASGQWTWELVVNASATVQNGLAQKGENMNEYYTPDQMKQFEELGMQVPLEERQQIEQGWTALLAEVRANRHLDPASPEAQALAERWDQLTEATSRPYQEHGYQDLWAAIGENYRQGNFTGLEGAPQSEDFAFIEKVKAARKAK